jgi:hypothetical protein
MTSSQMPARSWTPSTSSSSPPPWSTTSGAGSSRTSTATAAARTTPVPGPEHPARRRREPHRPATRPARDRLRRRRTPRRGRSRLAVRPAGPLRLPPGHPRRRPRRSPEGRRLLHLLPDPRSRPLGKTLKTWRTEFLGYFDTDGASNGGTEAINGLIELHRRIARGFRNRDNYRLRMLLIGGGLPYDPTLNGEEPKRIVSRMLAPVKSMTSRSMPEPETAHRGARRTPGRAGSPRPVASPRGRHRPP